MNYALWLCPAPAVPCGRGGCKEKGEGRQSLDEVNTVAAGLIRLGP